MDDGPPGASPAERRTSDGENTRPDPTWIFALGLLVLLEFYLTRRGGHANNFATSIFGLFGTALLLGFFRMKEASLQAGGRYSDWSFRARHVAVSLVSAGWLLGVLNLFFVAKEWSR